MLEVKVPAEIRSYKGKLIAGLSVRQVISIGAALAVGVPMGVFGGKILPGDLVMWGVILSVAPIVAWGFMKFKGMRFEEAVKVLFKFNFLPQRRVYEDADVNIFCQIREELSERDIRGQLIETGELEPDYETEVDYAL